MVGQTAQRKRIGVHYRKRAAAFTGCESGSAVLDIPSGGRAQLSPTQGHTVGADIFHNEIGVAAVLIDVVEVVLRVSAFL